MDRLKKHLRRPRDYLINLGFDKYSKLPRRFICFRNPFTGIYKSYSIKVSLMHKITREEDEVLKTTS